MLARASNYRHDLHQQYHSRPGACLFRGMVKMRPMFSDFDKVLGGPNEKMTGLYKIG